MTKQSSITESLQAANPDRFASCFAYAQAFNTLQADALREILHDGVVYGSQVVLETLEGKERVLWYLEGKIKTLAGAGAGSEVTMEIAGSPGGVPVPGLIVSQRSDASSSSNPVAWLELEYSDSGLITRLWMCTVAPHFSQALRTGVLPGR